jgi:endonuclease-3 related protein
MWLAPQKVTRRRLRAVYHRLLRRFGHAGWWPGETAFEVCVGAVLTQNTSWGNVEKVLGRLRRSGRLSFEGLRALPASRLAPLIRSSGSYNVKARRLRALLDFLASEYGGRTEAMRREDPSVLRGKLLCVPGIGPETADSIALYAAGHAFFVIDAYTRRVFARLGLVRGDESYDALQRFFMERLPPDATLYNDYHAQIVRLAKDVCRPRPRCGECPLESICPRRGVGHGSFRASPLALGEESAVRPRRHSERKARNPPARARLNLVWGRHGFDGIVTPRGAGRACLPAR